MDPAYPRTFARLRALNTALGVLGGVAQLALYARFTTVTRLADIVAIMGVSSFVMLADLGLTRPVASEVAKARALGRSSSRLLFVCSQAWLVLAVLVSVAMLMYTHVLLEFGSASLGSAQRTLFAMAIAQQASAIILRPLAHSAGHFELFELTDIARRLGLLIAAFMSAVDPTLLVSAIVAFSVSFICSFFVVSALKARPFHSGVHWALGAASSTRLLLRRFANVGMRAGTFSAAESITYASGWLILPGRVPAETLVAFAALQRIFAGAAPAIRFPFDAKAPQWLPALFGTTPLSLLRLTVPGFVVAALVSVVIVVGAPIWSDILLADSTVLSRHAMLAIALWILANSLRHPAGTLLLASGRYFGALAKLSFIEALLIGLIYVLAARYDSSATTAIASAGLTYTLFTLVLITKSYRSLGASN